MSASNSAEPSSDEDSDSNDTESTALRLLETISASGASMYFGGAPEAGLRASQLLRGAASGRRIASRSAIASLQSVSIVDLPESERSKSCPEQQFFYSLS
jgi:hypothetical protein